MGGMSRDWRGILVNPKDRAVLIDHRGLAEDLLAALRDRFGRDALASKRFDELIANYIDEPGPMTWDALGQQLTTSGRRLYQLETDTDDVAFVVVAEDEVDTFSATAKTLGVHPHWHRQDDHEPGQPAAWLTAPTPSELPRADLNGWVGPAAAADVHLIERHPRDANTFTTELSLLLTGSWPPVEVACGAPWVGSRKLAVDPVRQLACVVEAKDVVPAKGGPHRVFLAHGDLASADWQPIELPGEMPVLAPAPAFLGGDLLLAYQSFEAIGTAGGIWRVAADELRAELITGFGPDQVPSFTAVTGDDGRHWVLLGGNLHRYRDGVLEDTQLALGRDGNQQELLATAGGLVVTLEGTGAAIYDPDTGKARGRRSASLPRARPIELVDGWIGLLWGGPPTRSYDLAHLWHPETGTRLRIPYGYWGDVSPAGGLLIGGVPAPAVPDPDPAPAPAPATTGLLGRLKQLFRPDQQAASEPQPARPASKPELWVVDPNQGCVVNAGPFADLLADLAPVSDLGAQEWYEFHRKEGYPRYPRRVRIDPPDSPSFPD